MSTTVPNRPDPGDSYYDGTPPRMAARPSAPVVGHDWVTGVPLCQHGDDAEACQLTHVPEADNQPADLAAAAAYTPPRMAAQPSWIADGLQRMAAGLNEALLFAAPARAEEPMTRAALFMLIARAIAAGAPAPKSLEFETRSHGPELELTCADNDRTGVSLYGALFKLPLPRESGWIRRRGAQQVRSFGASSVRVNPTDERDPGEPTGPRLFHGWVVAVHCLVDAEPQPDTVVGVAQVAPATSEVQL